MTDPREALVDILVGLAREHGRLGVSARMQADAILAEFDVTPRRVHNHDIDPSCPETRLPDGSLRGECMTNATPPTVEGVARALYGDDIAQGRASLAWEEIDERDWYRSNARAVLALFEKGSEPERVEWEYGVRWGEDGTVKNYGSRERAECRASEPYGDTIIRRIAARTIPAGEWEEVSDE